MLEWLEENPQLTLKQLKEKFEAEGLHTSESSISRALKNSKITWKACLKIPTRWNGLDLKLKENVCKRNKCT